jgi:transcription elongation factor GreA
LIEALDGAVARRYTCALRPGRRDRQSVGAGSFFAVYQGFRRQQQRPKDEERVARETLITPNGLTKLKEELTYLETEKRREVADRIKAAREFGDINENSEYDDAKNEQAMLEHIDTEHVEVGAIVHVKDQKSGKSQKFQIVGSAEADPGEHKLSNESPIGKALIGHKRNEVVAIEVPRGPKRKLKITKIEAA